MGRVVQNSDQSGDSPLNAGDLKRRGSVARPDEIIADLRKQLDDINEYMAAHGEWTVSPTLKRFIEPVERLIELYVDAVTYDIVEQHHSDSE